MAYQLVLPSQANDGAYQRAPMVGPLALPAAAPAAVRSRLGLGCGCAEGLGMFDGGFNVSSWGWQEWGVIALGAYALVSMVFTTGRGVSRVRAIPGARRKRERDRLHKRLKELKLTK